MFIVSYGDQKFILDVIGFSLIKVWLNVYFFVINKMYSKSNAKGKKNISFIIWLLCTDVNVDVDVDIDVVFIYVFLSWIRCQ